MPTVTVNGKDVEIGASERLNCIQAAAKVGVEIPAYCWHPALSVVASCRMCLVEVGDRKPDGTVAMQPKLVPGCQTPAKDGTVIISDSQKVKDARKATLEYLLLNHPLDCPTCDHHRYEYLDVERGQLVTSLCGRNAIQISPPLSPALSLDLADRANQLRNVGEVRYNAHLLKFKTGGYELTVFPDGRCLIQGTDDPKVARSLYARYLGL